MADALGPGTVIASRYRIERELGSGGAGTTYLVTDELRSTGVALKVLDGERALAGRELRLLRGLSHPNLARMRDFGQLVDGRLFYTADYVRGVALEDDSLSWPVTSRALVGALEALRWLHAVGIRHGDVKGENILVRGDEGVLIDLSCAARFGPPAWISGTPGYIAPEVLAGHVADGHADRFAVGVLLERLLASQTLPGARAEQLAKLADDCRSAEPAARPDLAEIVTALGSEPVPLAAPYVEPVTLIGREAELERIERFVDGTTGAALVVVGEEGAGKSRLLEETRWLARERYRVVEGDASTSGGVAAMLRRAVADPTLPNDPVAAIEAVSRLASPTLFVLDDVDEAGSDDVAVARALFRAADGQAVVVGAARRGREWRDVAEVLRLAPLSAEAVATWTTGRLPAEHAGRVHRLTGGNPGALVGLMRALGWRDWGIEDLERLADAGEDDSAELAALGDDERRGLAALAASRLPIEVPSLADLDVSGATLAKLAGSGWVVRDDDGWRLSRRSFAEAALARLGDDERRRLHLGLVHVFADGTAEQRVEAARQAVLAGDERALSWLDGDEVKERPDDWVNVAREVVARCDEAEWLTRAVVVLERAGRSEEALQAIARARRAGGEPAPLWRLAAAAYLRAGKLERALRFATRAVARLTELEDQARALDLLSRIHLKRAEWADASQAAERGLDLAERGSAESALRADLHDDLGVAASYRGDLTGAREHLAQAAKGHREAGRVRAAARSASYRALADYRAGDTAAAADGYREALVLAERCGAADLIVYAAQNLGVATHQRGDLGEAAASYERGLALSVALGDTATEATLRTNLAKLYGDLGLLDRATDTARQAEGLANAAGLGLIAGTATSVQAEVALWRGQGELAAGLLARARGAFGEEATREVAETDLHQAEAHRLMDDRAAALEALEAVATALDALGDVEDLRSRLALGRAKLALDDGRLGEAISGFEEAGRLARSSGQRELDAECRAWCYRACRAQGADALADEHAAAARRLWERTAVSLPPERAEAYWRHPVRRMVPAAAPRGATVGPEAERFRRLLDINKRLSSSLDPETILPIAIDSALELTGAERGFVILAPEGDELRVAAARNIDPDEGDDDARFSQSIAQQVIAGGAPVITVDAQSDERFVSQKSVHAMQLKSVVGVPIIAPSGVIGALYLDHRFRRGIFGSEQVALLEAFADQVAIALENARLHQQLAARTAELDALTRGQAEQIDDLTARVLSQQQALETRYDYRNILGTSPAMQTVFKVLDRVIASDVPVLIQGESGTGKELIAKAIHFNGERRDRRLVSINCGALPENLLESELFGYVRGAFTGASDDRDGLFVAARGGTLFLDEVGEMPPSMQVKLLRALQEREVTPLGTAEAVPVDVRIVAASNRRLREEAEAGRFREDLYYRLGVVEVWMPPLRERGGDIALLVQALVKQAAEETGAPEPRFSKRALEALLDHPWPGNVRELENVVTKAVLLAEGGMVDVGDLGLAAPPRQAAQTRGEHEQATADRLRDTLQATGWNVSETSRRLGVSRPTVYRWMKRYGLDER